MICELTSVLDCLNRDNECRVILLGSSLDVFSSGGDIKAMLKKEDMFRESIDLWNQPHFGIQEVSRALERFRKPIIAVVDGACVGAGADLACMCDLRIGSGVLNFLKHFLICVPGDGGTFF